VDDAPVEEAVAVPSVVVPSRMVTVLSASAVPAIVGLVLFVEEVRVVRIGLTGAVRSTVTVIGAEAADILPAASLDLAVMIWAAAVSAVVGVKLQAPSEPAVTVPKALAPS
jgi:hypothetical protein